MGVTAGGQQKGVLDRDLLDHVRDLTAAGGRAGPVWSGMLHRPFTGSLPNHY